MDIKPFYLPTALATGALLAACGTTATTAGTSPTPTQSGPVTTDLTISLYGPVPPLAGDCGKGVQAYMNKYFHAYDAAKAAGKPLPKLPLYSTNHASVVGTGKQTYPSPTVSPGAKAGCYWEDDKAVPAPGTVYPANQQIFEK